MFQHSKIVTWSVFTFLASVTFAATSSLAAIIASGDLAPANLSAWTASTTAYIGNSSSGALTVNGASSLISGDCYLGFNHGTDGTVIIDGDHATWYDSGDLHIGSSGSATLKIMNGANVSNASAYIANTSAPANVFVSGAGSTWTNRGPLSLGLPGSSGFQPTSLRITNGGKVTAPLVSLDRGTMLFLNVGDGSTLDVGPGTITNNSNLVQLRAVRNIALGSYFPITAATWSGNFGVIPWGGIWLSSEHRFNVFPSVTCDAGKQITINTLVTQRVIFSDPRTNASLEVDLSPQSDPVNVIASVLTPDKQSLLQASLPDNCSVVDGWTFAMPGTGAFFNGYLSMQIGPGYSPADLFLWDTNSVGWEPYEPVEYDGNYATFPLFRSNGTNFALTALPEPASLTLLLLGALPLLRRSRNR